MGDFLEDLGYAARALRRSPGFAAITLLLLALGIGANALVFTLVERVLLRALPFPDPARLAAIWETTRNWDPKVFASYRDVDAFERQSRSFSAIGGCQWVEYTLSGHGDTRRVLGEAVTSGFFETLGVPAALGRTFTPADLNGAPALVLSYAGWKTFFGGAPGAIGAALTLDGRAYTVLGIMPRGFEFYPRQALFWTLLTPADVARQSSGKSHEMAAVGRLRPGVSTTAAEAELAALRATLEKADPDELPHAGAMVRGLQEELTWLAGRGLRSGLLLLFAAVAFVLLIACANVANLLAGRAMERRREIAIRAALGAGRGRLMRQILTESLLLSVLGALAGTLLAWGGLRYLRASRPVEMPIGVVVSLDWRVLIFAAALALLTAVLAGWLPALEATRFQIYGVLKQGGRGGSSGKTEQRSRNLLVILEVALSLTLLTGAALLTESLFRLRAEPMGYRLTGLLMTRLDLPRSAYPALSDRLAFCDRLSQSMAALPALDAALRSGRLLHAEVAGGPAARETSFIERPLISPEYFQVAAMPLISGREFGRLDTAQSEPVAIVDREFARRYLPGQDPLGKHIRVGELGGDQPWRTVVGVVGDINETNPFDEMHWKVQPHVYVPLKQSEPGGLRALVVMMRAGDRWLGPDDGPRDTLLTALRRAIAQIDAGLPLAEVTSLQQFLNAQAFSKPGFRAALLGAFAVLALLMAALGLYGVLAQLVVERRRELGVRMALGATQSDVARLVARRSVVLTATGIIVGSITASVGARFLRSFLLTGPGRPLVLLGVAGAMLAIALLAGIAPAWRAARIDPAVALREE
ncbi:MAG TPA: ADOP family duplicated permease [Bryobacteraceae bacterium]|nr:ADOP family duplicated permease [Bryobacteraceae bacterium]